MALVGLKIVEVNPLIFPLNSSSKSSFYFPSLQVSHQALLQGLSWLITEHLLYVLTDPSLLLETCYVVVNVLSALIRKPRKDWPFFGD